MTRVTITVPGDPVAWHRPRAGKGRVYTPAQNRRYAERVQAAWMVEGRPWLGQAPLALRARFAFGRPASHLRKDGRLRKGAPRFPPRTDLDNLWKAVTDPLEGLLFANDSQIVSSASSKLYAPDGEEPGVELWFAAYDDTE